MPSLMKTMRFSITYIPTIPQSTEAAMPAARALRMKSYESSSIMLPQYPVGHSVGNHVHRAAVGLLYVFWVKLLGAVIDEHLVETGDLGYVLGDGSDIMRDEYDGNSLLFVQLA